MKPLPSPSAVWAVFRRPGWALGLLALIVLAAAFVRLGEWQHGRYVTKAERNLRIEANYDQPPVPLATLLPTPQQTLDPAQRWRPVVVRGSFLGTQALVRNRPLAGKPGFEVLAALRLSDGSELIIDRGWVSDSAGQVPAALPSPPTGPVTVTAHLVPGESPVNRTLPPGQLQRIDLAAATATLNGSGSAQVYRAYGVLATQDPAAANAPTPLPRPDTDLGPHLGYAWQWWMFAFAAFGLYGYYLLKDAAQLPSQPAQSAQPRRRAAKASTRVSDEDWEDAITASSSASSASSSSRLETGR